MMISLHRFAVLTFSAFFVVASLAFALPSQAGDTTDKILEHARQAVDREQLDVALELLRAADPENSQQAARVDLLIGDIFLKVGKPSKAMEFFEHAALSTMDDTQAYVGMAKAALKQGKVSRARHHAQTALRGDADLAGAHLVLALADDRSGQIDKARKRFDDLSQTRSENESIAIAHAEFLFNRGDVDPAIQRLQRFTLMSEKSGAAHDALGRYLWAVGRHDDGLRHRAIAATLFLDQGNTYRAEPVVAWVTRRDTSGAYVRGLEKPSLLYKERPAPLQDAPHQPPSAQPTPAPLHPVPPPTVVRLAPLPIPPGAYSQGTGFVVGDGRYVVTNRHVIEGTDQIAVRNGIGEVRRAKVIKIADADDLAVLELASAFPSAQSIPNSRMGDARTGRAAIVLGYPMAGVLGEQMPSLTSGIVSKTAGFGNDPTTFLLTTKVNKGNSGGPVFDDRGNLIGVVVSKLDTLKIYEKRGFIPEDVNQAIKISRVFELMNWSSGTTPAPDETPPLALEDIYQIMLPKVVIIAGSLKGGGKK